jgi:glycosyltransferase involved in cell wall biosynthesis
LWEVIVIDNGSTDHPTGIVESWIDKLPCLRAIACEEPGANRACNAWVHASAADRILLCDQDDVVSTGWVNGLTRLSAHMTLSRPAGRHELNTPFIRRTRLHLANEELPTYGTCRSRRRKYGLPSVGVRRHRGLR